MNNFQRLSRVMTVSLRASRFTSIRQLDFFSLSDGKRTCQFNGGFCCSGERFIPHGNGCHLAAIKSHKFTVVSLSGPKGSLKLCRIDNSLSKGMLSGSVRRCRYSLLLCCALCCAFSSTLPAREAFLIW